MAKAFFLNAPSKLVCLASWRMVSGSHPINVGGDVFFTMSFQEVVDGESVVGSIFEIDFDKNEALLFFGDIERLAKKVREER